MIFASVGIKLVLPVFTKFDIEITNIRKRRLYTNLKPGRHASSVHATMHE